MLVAFVWLGVVYLLHSGDYIPWGLEEREEERTDDAAAVRPPPSILYLDNRWDEDGIYVGGNRYCGTFDGAT